MFVIAVKGGDDNTLAECLSCQLFANRNKVCKKLSLVNADDVKVSKQGHDVPQAGRHNRSTIPFPEGET